MKRNFVRNKQETVKLKNNLLKKTKSNVEIYYADLVIQTEKRAYNVFY